MIAETNCKGYSERKQQKLERLFYIKDRYRTLILEPRKEIECEIENDLKEDLRDISGFSHF